MDVIEGIAEEFITGNDPLIKCTKLLSSGGFGKVYEVLPSSRWSFLIVDESC
jgi:hypothetical protein